MVEKKHLEFLKKFKKRLSKRIQVNKLILFGSRARGKTERWADFDLMVVSENFKNEDSLNRAIGFYDYWDIDYPVDFLCYTPEEFEKLRKKISIVAEAMRDGVEIK